MKKIILGTITAAALLSTSAMATSDSSTEEGWYVGAEMQTGSGDRTYDRLNTINVDSDGTVIRVGYIQEDFDRIELTHTSKTLANSTNANDKDEITETKIVFAPSIVKLAYKNLMVPYWEAAIGAGSSDAWGSQLSTHLGIGILSEPIDNLLVNVGYRLTSSAGTANTVDYGDSHSDLVIGAAYKF
jgi:opacity protein-like surface antigen